MPRKIECSHCHQKFDRPSRRDDRRDNNGGREVQKADCPYCNHENKYQVNKHGRISRV